MRIHTRLFLPHSLLSPRLNFNSTLSFRQLLQRTLTEHPPGPGVRGAREGGMRAQPKKMAMRAQPGPWVSSRPARLGAQTPTPGPRPAARVGTEMASAEVRGAAETCGRPARGSHHVPVGPIKSLACGTETAIRLPGAEMSSSSCACRHASPGLAGNAPPTPRAVNSKGACAK